MSLKPSGTSHAHCQLRAISATPLTGFASVQLRFFVMGATGRTGVRFLSAALRRGHQVTVYVRDANKLPDVMALNPLLRVFSGALDNEKAIAMAVKAANPDVIYNMLGSETPPYTAVSTGTRSTLMALKEAKLAVEANSYPVPFISIAGWGLGPTEVYVTGLTRVFVAVATRLFWSRPRADFERQIHELSEARERGFVRPILILPPILSNSSQIVAYLSGDPRAIHRFMHITRIVSRASLADLCLKLGEKVASGDAVPQWVGITPS